MSLGDAPPDITAVADTAPTDSGSTEPERWPRRILVALDASSHSHAALAASVALAGRLHSELQGIFVEDINLLRLAELPFAREVRFGLPAARPVQGDELLRGLRARAAVLRRELEEVAEQNKVSSTFRVVRGAVAGELIAAALEADVLALGRMGHSLSRRARLGSTARAAIARAASAVLLVQPEVEAGPVLVLYDGSPSGGRALALAADLSEEGGELRVLVWGPDEASAFARRQLAAHLLEARGCQAQYQHLAGGSPRRVLAWVNKQHGSLLIVPAAGWPAEVLETLLDDAQPHLLIIR
jgi:nucleotide-binding universal stress UspA family protein